MIDLTVNGKSHTVASDPDTPLLYVLRNELALNGAKFGCGMGQCGACTVIVGGKAVFSCLVPLAGVGSRSVTTIEGLGSKEKPNPLQASFIEHQAVQCGYCIAGMITRTSPTECRPASDRGDTAFPYETQSMQVRHAHADTARHPGGSAGFVMRDGVDVGRRVFLKNGALVLSFSLFASLRASAQKVDTHGSEILAPNLAGSLNKNRYLDAWIKIDASGITVCTGKAELGTGVKTAMLQIAAEQLWVRPELITLVTADTDRTPDEGYTAGSHSIADGGRW
jgi:aerobic-type carbon monoxide dehydrogenase small subunit (CoxS/CutS family)